MKEEEKPGLAHWAARQNRGVKLLSEARGRSHELRVRAISVATRCESKTTEGGGLCFEVSGMASKETEQAMCSAF